MTRIFQNIIAAVLLIVMFVLLFSSAWNDSATMDELAHIPSGYSYVRFGDMRLNPEHPPLMKDLAGIAMLALRPNFPTDNSAWKDDINGQWEIGRVFLYRSGNNPDTIIRFARTPMMLLTILLGWMFFLWARRHYGGSVALLALFFFAFSPTFLAHGKYVTTDIAATFGFFLGIVTFLRFLNHPTRKNILVAGIGLGIALLLKFSLVLLLPIYLGLVLLWIAVSNFEHLEGLTRGKRIKHYFLYGLRLFKKIILIGIISGILIFIVYQLHVVNYPVEKQVYDTTVTLQTFGKRWMADPVIWMADKPLLRGISYYLLGLLMVIQRAAGGNDTYFLGMVAKDAWWYYFPVVYIVKETLALHILTLFALVLASLKVLRSKNKNVSGLRTWIREHFITCSLLFFIAFYWVYSVRTNLNIGIRHVLPTFLFIYLLVAKELKEWVQETFLTNPHTFTALLKSLYHLCIKPVPKYLFLLVMMLWIVITTLASWPGYLSYFNEITLFTMPGYQWVTDSNFDWGQDLKRLANWTQGHNVQTIALQYFGGGSPEYYLGDVYEPWWSSRGAPNGYVAISATNLMGSFGTPVGRFTRNPEDSYAWLRGIDPIATAGRSIFIFDLSKN